jgi:hypothetical protein
MPETKSKRDLPGLDIKEKGTSKKIKDTLIYEKHPSFNALRQSITAMG